MTAESRLKVGKRICARIGDSAHPVREGANVRKVCQRRSDSGDRRHQDYDGPEEHDTKRRLRSAPKVLEEHEEV